MLKQVAFVVLVLPLSVLAQKQGLMPGLKLPYFISQVPVKDDTSIINNADLKVYKLFDSRDTHVVRLGASLFKGIVACDQGEPELQIDQFLIRILPSGIEFDDSIHRCDEKIEQVNFTTNRKFKGERNGIYEFEYPEETRKFKTGLGKAFVETKMMQCDDTGNNPLRIISGRKDLYFKDIKNLAFFEFDADHDDQKELYIMDYESCNEKLRIYKVTR